MLRLVAVGDAVGGNGHNALVRRLRRNIGLDEVPAGSGHQSAGLSDSAKGQFTTIQHRGLSATFVPRSVVQLRGAERATSLDV
jgi:hypothetical protein